MFSSEQTISSILGLLATWTMFGVLMHDSQLDKAAVTAISPTGQYHESDAPTLRRSNPHTHSEHNPAEHVRNMRSSQPRLQPRRADDRPETVNRKQAKDNYSEKVPDLAEIAELLS